MDFRQSLRVDTKTQEVLAKVSAKYAAAARTVKTAKSVDTGRERGDDGGSPLSKGRSPEAKAGSSHESFASQTAKIAASAKAASHSGNSGGKTTGLGHSGPGHTGHGGNSGGHGHTGHSH